MKTPNDPTAHKIARILRHADYLNRAACARAMYDPMRYDNDDSMCYEFNSSMRYDNDSGQDRDFSISIEQ